VTANLESVIARLREIQPHLREQYGVSGLWVFGSYVRGNQSKDSDVDVLVEFDKPGMTLLRFVGLELELTELLGVKVDLVRCGALQPKIRPFVLTEAVAI
jgi:predicted nucleotidyltransferase